ncbi:MAG: GIY-YIG nuclease family protein [Cytophagales bacterium]|nr:GIY-YIG nuclease family protein [Cytophagales bacterium]
MDTSKLARRELQLMIDSKTISTGESLIQFVISKGWTITRCGKSKRYDKTYLGVLHSDGKRFRLRCDFEFEYSKFNIRNRGEPVQFEYSKFNIRNRGEPVQHFFYALFGNHPLGETKAVYIGQTVNFFRRMKEHYGGHSAGKSSYALFEWAGRSNVEIRVAMLAEVTTNASQAYLIESHFIKLAIRAGYLTPGIESWGRGAAIRRLANLPNEWLSDEAIHTKSLPLQKIVFPVQTQKMKSTSNLIPLFNFHI